MRGSAILAGARKNWALIAVLAVAALVRMAAAITYEPALMWSDSWQYLYATDLPGDFAPDKPNGYPLFLLAMGSGGHLAAVTAVQHVLGLAAGVLLFALLRRLGCGRGWATLASAVVLLDAYAIALEQHVLAEALFTFVLVSWAFVAVGTPRTASFAAASGALLVAAVAVRAVAIFVVPVWIAFALWGYRDRWARMAALGVVVVGLLGYTTWHDLSVGGRGLNQLDGWALYGRVSEIGECAGRAVPAEDRALCPPASNRPDGWPDIVAYSLFSPDAPPQREFGDLYGLQAAQRREANARLRAFASKVIADRPLAFLGIVLRDTGKYFVPGVMSPLAGFDDPVTFPEIPRPVNDAARGARRAYAPSYRPPPREPARALPAYQRWVHTPRWLLALLLAASAIALAARWLPGLRKRVDHGPEILLLSGAGLALVVGSSVNHFEPRFLIPAVPLIVAGGTTALCDLWRVRVMAPASSGTGKVEPWSSAPEVRASHDFP
jgi:hypothetical protein